MSNLYKIHAYVGTLVLGIVVYLSGPRVFHGVRGRVNYERSPFFFLK